MANALTAQAQQSPKFLSYVGRDDVKQSIESAVGKENTTLFLTPIVAAVQTNPKLAECTSASILSAGLQGFSLKLAPSPQLGQFYLVPHKTRKKIGNQWVEVKEATFQLGWKGYVQLAIRSGQYKSIVVSEIKEGEAVYNPITEDISLSPIMDPVEREKAKTVGYFASFELTNGFKKQIFSPKAHIEAHAKRYSDAYRYDLESGKKSSPWSTDFDAMARKTLIRELISKWGIMSVEMQQAFTRDMGVIDEDGSVRYVDNPKEADIEVAVAEDIETNANTVDFEDAEVMPAPTPEAVKAAEEAPEPAKRGRKKAEPKPEPVQTTIDIPEDDDDGPEWG